MINIIVPVYNEGENIKALMDELQDKVRTEFILVIIYDMDDDNTLPVIAQIKNDYPYEIVLRKNIYGCGFGNAVRTGIQTVESEFWVMTMADLSDKLETIDVMYEKILGGYDIVVGSRYMAGGHKNGGPFLQSLFSRCASLVMHFLMKLPVEDISNAFRMYRTEEVSDIELESTSGADILLELLIKAQLKGAKITQVPTDWYDRTNGTSHFRMWKLIPKYLHWCVYAIKEQLQRKHSGAEECIRY